jgi:crotonobetainyl-CoA:carnitine CoA-transferase CaiB-like acyl-CoA transferase
VVQGYSGWAAVQGTDGQPSLLRTLVCDKVTAYTTAQAITAALFARERDPKHDGQHIGMAMLDATVAFLWPDAAMDIALLEDDVQRRPTIGSGYNALRMADGWATTGAVSDSEFQGLCRALGRDDVADDPRFATLPDRIANIAHLGEANLAADAARITLDDFIEACDRFDVPAAPLRPLAALPDDPQATANEIFVETDHPTLGRLRDARPAATFSATPARVGAPAPSLGEHSDEILAQLSTKPS